MNRTLYAITQDVIDLNNRLDEIEGDCSRWPEGEAALTAWMDSLGSEQAAKLDGYVGLIRQLEMEAKAAHAESVEWDQKSRNLDSRARRLKDRLKEYLTLTGQSRATTATGRIVTIQANGGVAPVIFADSIDPTAIPDALCTVRREPNRVAIRDALERGESLPFARIGERGTSLRIK